MTAIGPNATPVAATLREHGYNVGGGGSSMGNSGGVCACVWGVRGGLGVVCVEGRWKSGGTEEPSRFIPCGANLKCFPQTCV